MLETGNSALHVEGRDDVHVIRNLLRRHDLMPENNAQPAPAGTPEIKETSGVKSLLKAIPIAIEFASGGSAGFVLDADDELQDQWRAVCGRLDGCGLDDLPKKIPPEGFIGYSELYKARVGVWLMPDNQRSGALEQFLEDLVKDCDALLPIAEESTQRAAQSGARFPKSAQQKAVLHAWLAWQESPGLPYGAAVTAQYFGHDSPAAKQFVEWYKGVFL